MIVDEPVGKYVCPSCGEVTVVYGDDGLMPREGQRCVRCLDPRQQAHDELVEAERHAIDCDMDDDCVCAA